MILLIKKINLKIKLINKFRNSKNKKYKLKIKLNNYKFKNKKYMDNQFMYVMKIFFLICQD